MNDLNIKCAASFGVNSGLVIELEIEIKVCRSLLARLNINLQESVISALLLYSYLKEEFS